MKKKFRILGAMALAIAMLGCVVTGCGQEKETSATNANEKVALISLENVNYVKYSDNAAQTALSFVKEGENWIYEADKEAKIVQAMFAENVTIFSNVLGNLEENATLEEYSLTEPMYTLEVKNADTSAVIHISETEEGVYYAIVDGTNKVYKIQDDVVNAMIFQISGLQEPVPGEEMYGYTQIDDEIYEDDTLMPDDEIYEEPSDIATEDEDMMDMPDDTEFPEDIPEDIPEDDTLIEE